MTYRTIALFTALMLAACGASEAPQNEPATSTQAHNQMDHDGMDHSRHDMDDMDDMTSMDTPAGNTGQTTGVIRSIGENGDFLTIDHGPIEGVGMSAMTMGFGALSNVDLSTFEVGDRVAFAVKRGRDGSYRITAICKTTNSEDSCLG